MEADGLPCEALAVGNSSYCTRHVAQCKGITHSGMSCTSVNIISRDVPYCRHHISQAPKSRYAEPIRQRAFNVIEEKGFPDSVQCTAITKKGKQCKGKPVRNYSVCKDHLTNDSAMISSSSASNVASSSAPAVPPEPSSDAAVGVPVLVSKEPAPNSDKHQVDSASTANDAVMPPYPKVAVAHLPSSESASQKVGSEVDSDDFEVIDDDESESDDASPAVDSNVVWDNMDEMEEPDFLQHMREVYEVNEPDEDEKFLMAHDSLAEDPSVVSESAQQPSNEPVAELKWTPTAQWTWNMSLEERWAVLNQVAAVERLFLGWLEQSVKAEVHVARRDYHEAKVKAASQIYEGKEVIGGTIVSLYIFHLQPAHHGCN
jgi:hypothetical protein